MRKTKSLVGSSYERLEDVVRQELNLSESLDETSEADDSIERRASFRCPVQGDEQKAVLVGRGGRTHTSRLIDQSAGGFTVAYAGKRKFEKGQILLLRTMSGRFEVAVVYSRPEEDHIRLGLLRLRDIDPEVSGSLSAATLFLIVMLASMSIYTFALLAR